MKPFRMPVLVFALLSLSTLAHAYLVNYEFEGVVNASNLEWAPVGKEMHGTLSFNPMEAIPASIEEAPSVFDLRPGSMRLMVTIGAHSAVAHNTGGAAAYFTTNGFYMAEVLFPDPFIDRFTFGANGAGLFDQNPINNLAGGRWENVNSGSEWYAQSIEQDEVDGTFTRFRFLDAKPTPEPSTWILFGSAMLTLGGYRWHRKRTTPDPIS